MGDYKMTNMFHNGHPVYEKMDKTCVIFVANDGRWVVFTEIHPTRGGIFNLQRQPTPSYPPTTGWIYATTGGGLQPDDSVTFVSRGMYNSCRL